ncbi:MAG: SMC-Scp complex subunit ScpB [Pseudolabrys sp.]|nr:SMC-Scp complex subunit ScpB [Pseudolabrys sp.]
MPRLAKKLVLVENENEQEGHAVADEQVTSVVHAVSREDVVAEEAIAEEAVAEDAVVESADEAQDETGREDETAQDDDSDDDDDDDDDDSDDDDEDDEEEDDDEDDEDEEVTESEAAGVDENTDDAETRTIAVSVVAVSAVAASAGETGREQGSSDGTADDDASTTPAQRPDEFRLLEALLFASKEPLDEATLAKRLPQGADVRASLRALQLEYAPRGVNLVRIGRKWTFRTAGDLAWLLTKNVVQTRKLSRAAIETLAIIAYHQPVTRAEVEEIRGVAAAKGTLDVLLETGWIRPRGRRKVPGRPITYGTSEVFLSHFGLEQIDDLPGLDELKGAGLLDGRIPPGFAIPVPSDDSTLRDDEDPLEPGDLLDLGLAPPPERTETD